MRGRILCAIGVAIAFAAMSGSASALITAVTGEVHQGAPPASVAINQHQHLDTGAGNGAHAFNEEQDHTTTSAITLDVCTSPTSPFVTCAVPKAGRIDGADDLSPGVIPAGTCIDSHLIHADAPGTGTVVYGARTGNPATRVDFATTILGVVLVSSNLSATDADPGLAPAVTYGTLDATRGLELSDTTDEIQVTSNATRVEIRFTVSGTADYDQIRVITLGDANTCPGQASELTLSPRTAENEVNTEHCVTATVKNQTGGPAAGVPVRFDVEGASETDAQPPDEDGSDTTDASGEAEHCYTGPETVGSDTIHAYADNDRDNTEDVPTDPSADATKLWGPAEANSVVVEPPVAENPVDTEHCVTATVRDIFGNPIPDERVRFVVTGTADRSGADETDDGGVAEFCYSSTTAGLDVITAHHDEENQGTQDPGELFGVATKLWTPGDPASVVLEPKLAENKVQEQHCVRATVRDAFGNLVPNAQVRFVVTGVNSANGSDATDGGGQAEFCYTGGTQAGPDDILAFADNDGDTEQDAGEPFDTAAKIWLPLEPAFLTLTPEEDENVVGDQHCLQAAVTDVFFNPNPNEPVRFVVTGTVQKQATVRTNSGGIAEFCYTSTAVGQDAIHAWADSVEENNQEDPGEPSDDATKTWHPGEPASVTLTPKTATNEVNTEHCVKAEVRDQFGNPTPEETIVFDVEGASEGDAPNDEDGSDQTDEFGNAQHCYTGPDLPGTDTITAFADFVDGGNGTRDPEEPQDTAEKTWVFPESTPGCEITITEGGWIETFTGSRGTFGGNAKVIEGTDPLGGPTTIETGQLQYHDHGVDLNFHSAEIVAIVCDEDGRADIFGMGTVNGALPVAFRNRVRDAGEPGRDDTYQLITNAYASGPEDNPLRGGNIQVHQRR